MSNWVEAGTTDELAEGAMKRVLVQGHEILLARVRDRYYAADNRCPHMGGNLSQGELDGTEVTCPRHGSRFDLTDGRVVRWLKGSGLLSMAGRLLKAPRPLGVYNVKIEGGRIMVEI